MKHLIAIIAAVCVAIAIVHFLTPSSTSVEVRQHQSAREQQTLANASANRR